MTKKKTYTRRVYLSIWRNDGGRVFDVDFLRKALAVRNEQYCYGSSSEASKTFKIVPATITFSV